MSIRRIWHGWTDPDQADAYQALLHNDVFPGIEAMEIPGFRGVELLRRDLGDEVEFLTIMTFDTLEDVIDFQGEDYVVAYVPDAARRVLKRWDATSAHYQAVARPINRME